jgi:hypothetical protein
MENPQVLVVELVRQPDTPARTEMPALIRVRKVCVSVRTPKDHGSQAAHGGYMANGSVLRLSDGTAAG